MKVEMYYLNNLKLQIFEMFIICKYSDFVIIKVLQLNRRKYFLYFTLWYIKNYKRLQCCLNNFNCMYLVYSKNLKV